MVDVDDGQNTKIDEVDMLNYNEQVNMVYPRDKEELIDFLNICKLKDFEVMLCPHYSLAFDNQAAKVVEKTRLMTYKPWRSCKRDMQGSFIFDKRGIPYIVQQSKIYVPPTNFTLGEWVRPTKKTDNDQHKWRLIKVGATLSYQDNSQVSKNYSYTSKNYLGKNLITRTQWRRHQRKTKASLEA